MYLLTHKEGWFRIIYSSLKYKNLQVFVNSQSREKIKVGYISLN